MALRTRGATFQEKVNSEKPIEEPTEPPEGERKPDSTEDDDPLYRVKVLVQAPGEEGKEETAKETTLGELPDDARGQVKIMIDNSRAQTKAAVQFIPHAYFARAPLARRPGGRGADESQRQDETG